MPRSQATVEKFFQLSLLGLVASGFLSIGCMPCTSRTDAGEDARAGRWRGQSKTECGIHTIKTS